MTEHSASIRIFATALVVVSMVPVVAAQSVAAENASGHDAHPVSPSLATRETPYRIHRGDSFDINFPYIEDFNQTVTVQPDGTLILKAVGALQVEHLNLQQLYAAVKTVYGGLLKDPVFTISPKDLEKPFFIAAGSLDHPGKYDLRSDLTISEAVAIAGGFNDKSKTSQVVLFRNVNDNVVESRVVDVKKMMASRDLKEDLTLKPGDMIWVPQNKISKIMRFMPNTGVGMYLTPVP